MKKLLLLALAAVPFVMSAQGPVPAEVESLTEGWKVTEGLPAGGNARWATAVDGKFYLRTRPNEIVEVFDQNGKAGEIASTASTFAISRDEVGNVIVFEGGAWPAGIFTPNDEAGAPVDQLRIIPADGSEPFVIPVDFTDITGFANGRSDYVGWAEGDIMDYGVFYAATNGDTQIWAFIFSEGEVVEIRPLSIDDSGAGIQVANQSPVTAFTNAAGDVQLINYVRSGNPVLFDINYNDVGDPVSVTGKALNTQAEGRTNLYGVTPFSIGGFNLVIFPSGAAANTYADAFKIAELTADGGFNVIYESAQTLADNALNNAGSCSEVFVVEPDPTSKVQAKIYQYAPGNYVRCLNLRLKHQVTAINTVDAQKTVSSVRYYNLQGVSSATPFDGMNIVVNTYSDGSRQASKLVK